MRVLLVVESLGRGGAEQSMLFMVPALASLGVQVDIAFLRHPATLTGEFRALGARVHDLRGGYRWRFGPAARRLAGLVSSGKYDIVHSKLFFPGIVNAISRWIGPRCGHVVSFHNLAYDFEVGVGSMLRKTLDRLVLPRSIDRFAALSRAVASSYRAALGIQDIRIIPNGVPTDELKPISLRRRFELREKWGLPVGEVVLAMPARLVPEKGHDTFIASLEILVREGLGFHAVIAGSGPLESSLRQRIARSSARSAMTTLLQGLSAPDAREVMAASDVVVVPSRYEGFGLAPAEAMALGVSVVTSAVGGLLDLVQGGVSGLQCAADDPRSLADCLSTVILNEPLRAQLGAAGRKRIEDHFDVKKVAGLWRSLYIEAREQARGGIS